MAHSIAKIPVLAGATGSGKSALIYDFCDKFNACELFEIVSADASQVYRGLDIGTSKPSASEMAKYRHHMVDIVDTDGSYTTGDYVESAETVISEVMERGKTPVIVGGTGLYIQSLRDGLFQTPPPDEGYREELRTISELKGSEYLHGQLAEVDAESAKRIHPNDLVRIIRGLEVWKQTGVAISVAHKMFCRPPKHEYHIMVLDRDREMLYSRINERVDSMLAAGWLAEVQSLVDAGYSMDMPAFKALGYKELAQVLSGELAFQAAKELISQKTRNFAKRQMTWFRGMPDVHFMTEAEIIEQLKGYL